MDAKYKIESYKYNEVCHFRKTKELYGGLSNMAGGFPININGIPIRTSEALYQACRYPHLPDVQKKIIQMTSPMSAKMVSKSYLNSVRPDWDVVRVPIMYWCLRVKLAQNLNSFGQLLESTNDMPIVEDSWKDDFWGAIADNSPNSVGTNSVTLTGVNALGKLLMRLRTVYKSSSHTDLLSVEPLAIPNFKFNNELIQPVDGKHLSFYPWTVRNIYCDNSYK